jgi:hypothetical protein
MQNGGNIGGEETAETLTLVTTTVAIVFCSPLNLTGIIVSSLSAADADAA